MHCMEVQHPDITAERISEWIQEFAKGRTTSSMCDAEALGFYSLSLPSAPAYSFEEVEAALRRAQSKTYVRTIKMLRRCFRNQGAVNDSLIAAVCELIAVNRQMSDEVRLLYGWLAAAQREMKQLHFDAGIQRSRLEQLRADFLSPEFKPASRSAVQSSVLE
jgi:hypothetical protein